jgi:sugar lactone lactonase YvrE
LTSSCCLDPDGNTLYITTARNTLSSEVLRQEPLAGSVFRADLPV